MTLAAWAHGMAALVALLLVSPAIFLFLQVLLAPRRPALAAATGSRLPVAVLIPAHNEALGIAATLQPLMQQIRPGDRVVVVADNCTDDTALIARCCGAEAVERHDLLLRGKGHALNHGVQHLSADPPDVLVMLDADCMIHPGALDRLAQVCRATAMPCQALYLMRSPVPASLRLRFAEFAWTVKNQVRPAGSQRIGGPCQLMGTGMAFPWPLISKASLASGHLAEDMKLGAELAAAGHAPAFVPSALVTSVFPTGDAATRSQRRRWEQGHLATIFKDGPALVGHAVRQRSLATLLFAFDLMVPPLALLVLLLLALAAAGLVLMFLWGWAMPLGLAGIGVICVVLAIGLAWFRHARHLLSGSELLLAPWYLVKKLPLYADMLLRRSSGWVRAKREGE